MNDSDRAALVDGIAKRIDTFCEHVGYGDRDVTRDEAESYVDEIEEALTARDDADLTSAYLAGVEKGKEQAGMVDDDAVERAKRAIISVIERYADDTVMVNDSTPIGNVAPDMARAALTAAPGAGFDLDAALDAVHPECYISGMRQVSSSWHVWLDWPTLMTGPILGTGSTRGSAIRNAVANAHTALIAPRREEVGS